MTSLALGPILRGHGCSPSSAGPAVEWDPLAAEWAAALATTQVLAHLAGRSTEVAAATFELGPVRLDLAAAGLARRPVVRL